MTSASSSPPPRRRRGGASRGGRRSSASPVSAPVPEIASDIPWETGDELPPTTFKNLGLDSRLMAGCADMGYEDTRPVQTAVIPMALEGRDVVACAETGTGKTLGFVVPILQRLLHRAAALRRLAA